MTLPSATGSTKYFLVGSAFLVSLALVRLLLGDLGSAWLLAAQSLLGVLVYLLSRKYRRLAASVAGTALMLLVAGGVFETASFWTSWRPDLPGLAAPTSEKGYWLIRGQAANSSAKKEYLLLGSSDRVTVDLDVRVVEQAPAESSWIIPNDPIAVSRGGRGSALLSFSSGGDPYALLRVEQQFLNGAETLEARVRLSAPEVDILCGKLQLVSSVGKLSNEIDICLGREPQDFALNTDVHGFKGDYLDLVLNDFNGGVVESFDSELYLLDSLGLRQKVTPSPRGAVLTSEIGTEVSSERTELIADWTRMSLPIDTQGANYFLRKLTVRIGSENGSVVEVGPIAIDAGATMLVLPNLLPVRMSLGTVDPNTGAHSAVLVLAVLTLWIIKASGRLGLVCVVNVTIVGILVGLTGSRAGSIGYLIVVVYLLWWYIRREGRRRRQGVGQAIKAAIVGVLFLGVVLVVTLSSLTSPRLDGAADSRFAIWKTAVAVAIQNPMAGSQAELRLPDGSMYQHAHNLWLDYWLRYGVPGLCTIVAVSITWLRATVGSPQLLALVLAMLLNTIDTTFFSALVFVPLVAALGANFGSGRARHGCREF